MKPTVIGRFNLKAFGLSTALLLPANFQLSVSETTEAITQDRLEVVKIDHEARISHARELLGARAAGLADVTAVGVPGAMAVFIENHVSASLRESDKGHATAIAEAIMRESARHRMDPIFLMAIIAQESRFNTRIVGSAGEIGLMQIKPSTAAWIAERSGIKLRGADSLFEPATNIRMGAAYFAYLRGKFRSDAVAYVAAYNMGPVAVKRKLASNIVPEIYAGGVMGKYRSIYRKLASRTSDTRIFNVSMGQGTNGQVFGRISN